MWYLRADRRPSSSRAMVTDTLIPVFELLPTGKPRKFVAVDIAMVMAVSLVVYRPKHAPV